MPEGIAEDALSLEDFAADTFGGDLMGETAPGPTDAPPESTPSPAPSPTPAEAPPATPEEVPAVEPPSAPPADAPAVASDEPPVAAADDPFKDATPFTYTVNGVAKTFDGIKVLGTDGAVVDPKILPDLARKLGERDHLYDTNQQLYRRVQQFDTLTHKSGPQGQEREYRGVEAFRQLAADKASIDAAGFHLLTTLREAFPGPENAAVLKGIFETAELKGRVAASAERERFQTVQEDTSTRTAELQGVEQTFRGELAKIKAALPNLTDEDMASGEKHFRDMGAVIARRATAVEAQQYGLQVGQWFVDTPKMHGWFQDRDALRASMKERDARTAQAVATTTTAGKENQARLAAAARGTKGTRAVTPAPARQSGRTGKTAAEERAEASDAAWDFREQMLSRR